MSSLTSPGRPFYGFDHPTYGRIPPYYSPPISEEVADMAQKIAADELARPWDDPTFRSGLQVAADAGDYVPLYAFVRQMMGRDARVDVDHPSADDESISEGIVRAINAAD